MSNEDGVGTPIWTPKILDGGQEKAEKKASLPVGSRLAWNIVGEVKPGDTEFEIRVGQGETKFRLIGAPEEAVRVVTALRVVEKMERNAMRLALQRIKDGGTDLSIDPSVSAYDESEHEKLNMFFGWFQNVGAFLLGMGKRPWDGKVSEENEGQSQAAVQFSLVKNEGGIKDESTEN